jgi:hypothetical protein
LPVKSEIRKNFAGQKVKSGKTFPVKNKNPENIFSRARNFRKYFFGKIRTRTYRQIRIIPTPPKTGQLLLKPTILRGDLNRGV